MNTVLEKKIKGTKNIDASYIEKAMTYEEYRRLIDALIMVGRSTAKNESGSLLDYSKLNVVRMNRLDKTTEILPELKEVIERIEKSQTWLVLTEGWCGDAAQIIPVLHKITELNTKLQLRLLLRDENLELMDVYLTNGKSRSIPKLIVLDENNNEIFNWGPRPKVLQEMFYHLRANAVPNDVIKEEMHKWYAKDKTVTTQKDILELIKQA